MLFHAWSGMPGFADVAQQVQQYPINYGRTGVQLFFVLSGFLLSLPYMRWILQGKPRPSVRKFYIRRLLRVGPAYWASLAALTVFSLTGWPALRDVLLHIVFLSNVLNSSIYSINSVYWTMAIEVQFYVLLPGIAWCMWALGTRIDARAAVGLGVGALFVVSVVAGYLARRVSPTSLTSGLIVGGPSVFHWLDVFGDGIACGAVFVILTTPAAVAGTAAPWIRRGAALSTFLGLGLVLSLTFVPRLHTIQMQGELFGIAYAAILIGLLLGPRSLCVPLEWAPLRFIGLISYSLYIWHSVVMDHIVPHLSGIGPTSRVAVGFLLEVVLSVPVAYISFHLTEHPFMRARVRARDEIGVQPAS